MDFVVETITSFNQFEINYKFSFNLITELKKDVESAKLLGTAAAAAAAAHHHQHAQPAHHHHHHKGFIGTMAEMSLLQKKADEYHKSISASD